MLSEGGQIHVHDLRFMRAGTRDGERPGDAEAPPPEGGSQRGVSRSRAERSKHGFFRLSVSVRRGARPDAEPERDVRPGVRVGVSASVGGF